MAERGTFIINPEGKVVAYEVTAGNVGRNAEELLRRVQASHAGPPPTITRSYKSLYNSLLLFIVPPITSLPNQVFYRKRGICHRRRLCSSRRGNFSYEICQQGSDDCKRGVFYLCKNSCGTGRKISQNNSGIFSCSCTDETYFSRFTAATAPSETAVTTCLKSLMHTSPALSELAQKFEHKVIVKACCDKSELSDKIRGFIQELKEVSPNIICEEFLHLRIILQIKHFSFHLL